MAYKIFTDATADLNDELLRGLPQIEVIPMQITIGAETYIYGLNEGISAEEFYQKLRDGKYASTSQINPSIYSDYFSRALNDGFDVLYLSFSSELSSTYTSAELSRIELEEEYPDRKIICVDTLCAAVGEGLLVCEALRKQQEGMGVEELASWIEEHKLNVCHWFTVDTFEHLKNGGRVSAATAALGSTLNIKPLLHVTNEGTLQVKEKPRGRKQALKTQIRKLEDGWRPELGKQIIIGHGDSMDRAMEMKKLIYEKYPDAEIQIADIGAVIGSHVGPDVLALIYWGNNR